MDKNTNYFIKKNNKTSEVILIDYDQKDGYQINPKVKKENEINVNKIVFMSPNLSEKLIRKKIDKRIGYLLNQLKVIDEDSSDDGIIEKTLMDAEKLRVMIINNYVKYLGNTYQSLTLKKIQIIINELKIKLYNNQTKNIPSFFMNFEPKEMGMEYEEEKRGRGR